MEFDSVQIGAADGAAAQAYEVLLGVPAARAPNGTRRFQLQHGAVELEPGAPGLRSMRFTAGTEAEHTRWQADSFHGLRVSVTAATTQPPPATTADGVQAIDHVVIHTPDPDRAIALWRDQVGLRLALDRAFPKRGLRLVFFRSSGVTLEFAGPLPAPTDRSGPDLLYGIAYRVQQLGTCRARLLAAGLDISELRPGHKSGTTVATVRSLDVPTLLIEDPSRIA